MTSVDFSFDQEHLNLCITSDQYCGLHFEEHHCVAVHNLLQFWCRYYRPKTQCNAVLTINKLDKQKQAQN